MITKNRSREQGKEKGYQPLIRTWITITIQRMKIPYLQKINIIKSDPRFLAPQTIFIATILKRAGVKGSVFRKQLYS